MIGVQWSRFQALVLFFILYYLPSVLLLIAEPFIVVGGHPKVIDIKELLDVLNSSARHLQHGHEHGIIVAHLKPFALIILEVLLVDLAEERGLKWPQLADLQIKVSVIAGSLLACLIGPRPAFPNIIPIPYYYDAGRINHICLPLLINHIEYLQDVLPCQLIVPVNCQNYIFLSAMISNCSIESVKCASWSIILEQGNFYICGQLADKI